MTAQIVEIAGQRIAMLPADEFEKLLELAEDQSDAAAADVPWGERFFHISDPDGHEMSFAKLLV